MYLYLQRYPTCQPLIRGPPSAWLSESLLGLDPAACASALPAPVILAVSVERVSALDRPRSLAVY